MSYEKKKGRPLPGLLIAVKEIRGKCPAYRAGDSFRIEEGFKLAADFPLCMHSLASLLPYYAALSRGVRPRDLGLAGEGDAAYLQCLDPCDYTGGGTVIFEVVVEE